MKRALNKILPFALSAIMIFSLSACNSPKTASTDNTTSDSSDTAAASSETKEIDGVKDYSTAEFLTVDFFDTPGNYQGIQPGWVGALFKEKFNIEVNILSPQVAGGGTQMYQTRSAAGNLGDIACIYNYQFKECVDAELFLDITQYVNKQKNLEPYKLGIDTINQGIGSEAIYGIPGNMSTAPVTEVSSVLPMIAPFARWDYYKEIGYPEINNDEDLLNVLKQMQDAHPIAEDGKKVYAISEFKDWDGTFMSSAGRMASLHGVQGGPGFLLSSPDYTENQDILEDNSPYYDALKFYYNANQMGILDPDSATQSWNDVITKTKESKALFNWCSWAGFSNYNSEQNSIDGKGFKLLPIKDQVYNWNGNSPYGNGYVISVGQQAKDPERMVAFLDYLASPEYLGNYSLKGLTWDLDETGAPILTEYGKNAYAEDRDVPEEFGGGKYRSGMSQLNMQIGQGGNDENPLLPGYKYDSSTWPQSIIDGTHSLEIDWNEKMDAAGDMDYLLKNDLMKVIPANTYVSPSEDTDLSTARSQCGNAIVQASWQMVYAKDEAEFDKIWADVKKQVEGLGYEECLKADRENGAKFAEACAETMKNAN